jgi:hypothetical protein
MHFTLIPVLAASIAVALTKLSDTFQDIPTHLSPSTQLHYYCLLD